MIPGMAAFVAKALGMDISTVAIISVFVLMVLAWLTWQFVFPYLVGRLMVKVGEKLEAKVAPHIHAAMEAESQRASDAVRASRDSPETPV